MEDGLGKSNKAMPKMYLAQKNEAYERWGKNKISEKMDVLYQKSDEWNAWLKYKTSVLKPLAKFVEWVEVGFNTVKLGGTRICKKPSQRLGNFSNWKQLPSAENKFSYFSDKKTKKAVAEAMKIEAAKEMEEIRNERWRRKRVTAGKNCIKDNNGKIEFTEEGQKRV